MSRQSLRKALLAALGVALLVPASAVAAPDGDGDPDLVKVPFLHGKRVQAAKAALEAAGLKLGTKYEMSWRRALDRWGKNIPVGSIIAQAPSYGRMKSRGAKVAIIVSAEQDGLLPRRLPPATRKPTDPKPADPQPADPAPETDEPKDEAAEQDDEQTPPPSPDAPTPSDDDPKSPPTPAVATGSPEAPRPAPKPNPDIVPPLMGLDLAVAEQLCRDAKMTVHVERVAGHPVGRVLEQKPEAYEPRGPGGVVRVIVTAGGDFEAKMAPAPSVHVDHVDVPELLDRTEAQALRILRDLRLVGQALPAKRGLPGRVSGQDPLPGERIGVGDLVKIYIGPARDVTKPKKGADKTQPVPTSVAAPRPVSPAGNTPMPKTAQVAAGFTWQAVAGATAYVLEIEEQGASGAWMQSVRKPVRKTAAMVELERLDTKTARPLRWRVRAVVNGVQGNPSEWVVLR